MRIVSLSTLSFLLTAGVVGNAYYQKKQFYPAVVYITKSNASMTVIYIQFFVLVLMLGKLLKKIFLGSLRPIEFEHLMDRFWYALTETCLAFTVFRDDFNPRFVGLFTVLLFLKSFHWLAEGRVDFMERSPVIGWIFHVRVTSLLTILGILDYFMIMHAYNSTISIGPTVQLVFGFEYAILITMVTNTTIKYVLHAAEIRSDTPWENKAVFLLYTELIIGLIKVILYVLFVIIMANIYALPMFVFRPMLYTMRNFKRALNDVIMSRRAIRNMNTLYPDATPEELSTSDNICIICREDMVSNSKKLPCGHIFHTACLRSWFQRQQTCPTCRLNILRTTTNSQSLPRSNNGNPTNQNQNNAPNQTPIPGLNINNNNNSNSNNNNVTRENPFANLFAQGMGNLPNFAGGSSAQFAPTSPFILPPYSFFTPYAVPPPPAPPQLDTLTTEEIRAMEGNERQHITERIKLLRNIQVLLDASVILMDQYTAITARLPPVTVPVTSTVEASTSTALASVSTTNTTVTTSASPLASLNINVQPSTSDQEQSILKEKSTMTESRLDKEKPTKTISIESSFLPRTQSQEKEQNYEVKIEDIGSEKYIDETRDIKNTPQTNKSNHDPTLLTENTEITEIRKRRLQKFLQNERNGDNPTNE